MQMQVVKGGIAGFSLLSLQKRLIAALPLLCFDGLLCEPCSNLSLQESNAKDGKSKGKKEALPAHL